MSITTTITVTGSNSRLYYYNHIKWQNRQQQQHCFRVIHSSSDSKPGRGFGRQSTNNKDYKANKETTSRGEQDLVLEKRKSSTKLPGTTNRAPGLSFRADGKSSNIAMDLQFEERVEAVKRSALEQKKIDESKEYRAIDYDAPVESDPSTIGLSTKIGIGGAIVVFGLVFALGDFLPTGSDSPIEEATIVNSKHSEEERTNLQTRLQQYESMLAASPEDPAALEATAVTLAELGEYTRAGSLLEDLTKKKPNDPDPFRLLGEVKYELRDYDGSAAAYRRSAMVSKTINFEVLRGLTNALLAAKKPDEALQVLLASREHLNIEKSNDGSMNADRSSLETDSQAVDPIQVELLLGKVYSDWVINKVKDKDNNDIDQFDLFSKKLCFKFPPKFTNSSFRTTRFFSKSSPSSTSRPSSHRDFSMLPDDVLTKIAATFSHPNLQTASLVCKSWRDGLRPLREAMVFLRWGKRFKHGRGGVKPNLQKALDSFLKGAARGSTLAMVDAGLVYWEMGRKKEGIALYQRAAVLGDPAGQCNLGISYLKAEPPKAEEAVKWLRQASVAGHVRAQYQLALCLHQAQGVERNLPEAARWYLRAAEGGYVRAMYNTSLCFLVGEGFTQSHRLARKWMKRAADCGHSKAQFEHGLGLFSEGEMMKAVVYLELATRAGETAAAHVKNVILQQLSVTSRDRAMILADNWRALPLSR